MRRLKLLVVIVLAVCMIMSTLGLQQPTEVYADAFVPTKGLIIDGKQWTTNSGGFDGAGRSWWWDGAGSIVLDNFKSDHPISWFMISDDVTITLKGKNSVKGGFFGHSGKLTITGDGSLETPFIESKQPLTIKDTTINFDDKYLRSDDDFPNQAIRSSGGNIDIVNSSVSVNQNNNFNTSHTYYIYGSLSNNILSIIDSNVTIKITGPSDYDNIEHGIVEGAIKIDNSNVSVKLAKPGVTMRAVGRVIEKTVEIKNGERIATEKTIVKDGIIQIKNAKITTNNVSIYTVIPEKEGLDYGMQFTGKGKGKSFKYDEYINSEKSLLTDSIEIKANDQSKVCKPVSTPSKPSTPSNPGDSSKPGEKPATETISSSVWVRLYGAGRYDTMKAIVDEGFKGTGGTVIVATGGSFKDALSACGLAGLFKAPVVLTDGNNLSKQAKAVLERLKPKKVYIAGGEAAVSRTVFNEIKNATKVTPVRLAGNTSSGTSAKLALEGKGKWKEGIAIIATNKNYKDALSAAPIAYAKGYPILLADDGKKLSKDVEDALKSIGVKKVIIVGGTGAVSSNVETQLKNKGISVMKRLAGANGVETSRMIAEWGISNGLSPNKMGISTSQNYPDALAGAALCGYNGSVILLADDKATANTSFVQKYKSRISKGYIFGGPSAVGDKTWNTIVSSTATIKREVAKSNKTEMGRDYSNWAKAAGTIRPVEYANLCHIANTVSLATGISDAQKSLLAYQYIVGEKEKEKYAFPDGHPLKSISKSQVTYFNKMGMDGIQIIIDAESAIVIFAGTNKKNATDVLADIGIFLGDVTLTRKSGDTLLKYVIKKSVEAASGVSRNLQVDYAYSIVSNIEAAGINNIFITGHSLGGYLAELTSVCVRSVVECYSFDPPGMAPSVSKEIKSFPSLAKRLHSIVNVGSIVSSGLKGFETYTHDHIPKNQFHVLRLNGYLATPPEKDTLMFTNHSIESTKRTIGSYGDPEKRVEWVKEISRPDKEYHGPKYEGESGTGGR